MMARRMPLDGIRVVEFRHSVMGPTCALGYSGEEVERLIARRIVRAA